MIRADLTQPRNSHHSIYSTHDVGVEERADYWGGITARYFGPIETRATSNLSLIHI